MWIPGWAEELVTHMYAGLPDIGGVNSTQTFTFQLWSQAQVFVECSKKIIDGDIC